MEKYLSTHLNFFKALVMLLHTRPVTIAAWICTLTIYGKLTFPRTDRKSTPSFSLEGFILLWNSPESFIPPNFHTLPNSNLPWYPELWMTVPLGPMKHKFRTFFHKNAQSQGLNFIRLSYPLVLDCFTNIFLNLSKIKKLIENVVLTLIFAWYWQPVSKLTNNLHLTDIFYVVWINFFWVYIPIVAGMYA